MSQITITPNSDGSLTISQGEAPAPVADVASASPESRGNYRQGQGGNWNGKRAMPGDEIFYAVMPPVLEGLGMELDEVLFIGNAADTQEKTKPISLVVQDILNTEGGRSYPGNRYLVNRRYNEETSSDDAKNATNNIMHVGVGPSVKSKDRNRHAHTNKVREAMLEREVEVGDTVLFQTYRRVRNCVFTTTAGETWKLDIFVFSHYVKEAEASPESSEE